MLADRPLQLQKQWKDMDLDERLDFLESAERGDSIISHKNPHIDKKIEALVPFALTDVEIFSAKRLVIVPEYSGPSVKRANQDIVDRVEADLSLYVILPVDTICIW